MDIWEFGEIIYGKIGGDFIWGILYGFCGEWIEIVGEFFGIFFWIKGALKFQTKIWPEKFFKKGTTFILIGGVMFFWAKNPATIHSHNYALPFGCGRAGVMEGRLT